VGHQTFLQQVDKAGPQAAFDDMSAIHPDHRAPARRAGRYPRQPLELGAFKAAERLPGCTRSDSFTRLLRRAAGKYESF
jgi:hypothetical protein